MSQSSDISSSGVPSTVCGSTHIGADAPGIKALQERTMYSSFWRSIFVEKAWAGKWLASLWVEGDVNKE